MEYPTNHLNFLVENTTAFLYSDWLYFLWHGIKEDVCRNIFTCCCFVLFLDMWPSGTYGLPRSTSGCPQSNGFQWKTGWRYQDTEDTNPNSHSSSSFHLDGLVTSSNVKRSFCIKEDDNFDNNRGTWPKGNSRIFTDKIIILATVNKAYYNH